MGFRWMLEPLQAKDHPLGLDAQAYLAPQQQEPTTRPAALGWVEPDPAPLLSTSCLAAGYAFTCTWASCAGRDGCWEESVLAL